MPKETLKQRDKRKLDLQLEKELEGTFPASDPLTVTREPASKDGADWGAAEHKPAGVSGSAEAQPPKKK